MTMKRAMTVLGVLLSLVCASPAFAQGNDPTVDPINRRNIQPCPVATFEKYADTAAYPGYWLWDADHAGVNPVNTAVRSANRRRVSEYFRGVVPGRRYSANERTILAEARIANEAAIASQAYTPAGTPVDQLPTNVPNNDYENLILPTTDDFEEVVLPCGSVLELGITGMHRSPDGRRELTTTHHFAVIAWSERGVKTKDGVPGVRALVAKDSWQPSTGPMAGATLKVGIIRNCGNPFIEKAPVQERVTVPAVVAPVPQQTVRALPEATPQQLNPEPPRPVRPVVPQAPRIPRSPADEFVVTGGVGMMFGKVQSEYTDPVPNSGDVPQRHNFTAVVPFVRFDQHRNRGLFVYASASVAGGTSTMQFQDITGAWIDKKRDSDDSKDRFLKAKAGWKFALGESLSVGVFGGFTRWCICEQYNAQGATTTTERSYAGAIVGGELSGTTERLRISVTGEFGPALTRKAFTHQVYGEIDFPKVTNPDADAKSFGFKAEGEVKIAGPLNAFAAWEYLGITSKRTNTFTANERVNVNAATVGVAVKWGR